MKIIVNTIFWGCVGASIATSIFGDAMYLILFKIIATLMICVRYVMQPSEGKKYFFFLLGMGFAMIGESLIALDFIGYKKEIYFVFALYYYTCCIVLIPEVRKIEFKRKQFFSAPLLIKTLLLVYLSITVIPIVYPKLQGMEIYMILIIVSLFLFSYLSFYIYFNKPNVKGTWLITTVFAFIFLNVIVPINYLYYYSDTILPIVSFVELASHFFLMKFLLEKEEQKTVATEVLL